MRGEIRMNDKTMTETVALGSFAHTAEGVQFCCSGPAGEHRLTLKPMGTPCRMDVERTGLQCAALALGLVYLPKNPTASLWAAGMHMAHMAARSLYVVDIDEKEGLFRLYRKRAVVGTRRAKGRVA